MDTMILYPYLKGQVWVFDDEKQNLKEEAFVQGMSEIIDATLAKKGKIRKAKKGFKLTFSDKPFVGHDVKLTWFKPGNLEGKYTLEIDGKMQTFEFCIKGDWYHTGRSFKKRMEGWLCPALLKYFDTPPKHLYCSAESLPKGVNPIWDKPQDATAFVTTAHVA